MTILLLEAIASSPHLETSGEIALSLNKNKNVSYSWIGHDLPWNDWETPKILRILNIKLENRIPNFLKILKKENIKIITHKEHIHENDYYYNFKKKILKQKFNSNNIKNIKYKNINIGWGVLSSLISYYKSNDINFKKSNIVKIILSSALIVERSLNVIEKVKPTKIITFNNRFFFSYPIIQISKKLRIPIFRHERGSDYNKYEIYEKDVHDYRYIRNQINKYWKNSNLSEEIKIKIAKKYFYDRRNKKKIGRDIDVSFLSKQKKGAVNINHLDPKKRKFVYYTSSNYEYTSFTNDFGQQKAVKNLIKIIKRLKNIELIIRVHPSNNNFALKEDKNWLKFKDKNIHVLTSSDKTDSYELMNIADIVITYSSNIILEAAFFGKTSVSMADNMMYSDCKRIITATDRDKLQKILSPGYKHKSKNYLSCLPVAFYFSTFGKKFKYYKPLNFFEGKLKGYKLEWKPLLLRVFEQLGIKKIFNLLKFKFR